MSRPLATACECNTYAGKWIWSREKEKKERNAWENNEKVMPQIKEWYISKMNIDKHNMLESESFFFSKLTT